MNKLGFRRDQMILQHDNNSPKHNVEYMRIFMEKNMKKTIGIRLDNVRVLLSS